MFHHSDGDYDEAASRAASVGRQKMEEIIHRGQVSAEAVVATIQNSRITDKVAPANRIRLHAKEDDGGNFTYQLGTVDPDHREGYTGYGYTSDDFNDLHPHAFGQLMTEVGFGSGIASDIVHTEAKGKRWGYELVERMVNDILSHRTSAKDRHLIRIDEDAGSKVKGFLSDKYKRLDARITLDSFMGLCTETGLVPIEGVASDVKARVRAVMPRVFEPIDNEVMIFGLEFGTGDYGGVGMVLNLWTMRMMCTNLAVTQKGLRQIHLGSRLPDDVALSARTYELNAMAAASALRDSGRDLIGPGKINAMLENVRNASKEEIRTADGIDKYLRGLSKGESQTVRQLFDSPDVVNLPVGQTPYRLSNAVSFFAQSKHLGADRKIELQEIAGQIITPKQDAAKVREV